LIKTYLENIRASEDNIADENTTENVEMVTRGRPKSASHDKNIVTEKSSKKRGQYTCGLYKQLGHNIATCPYK
ncbi:8469_t:CDS:2, partial [Gigaspora margarita]